ncbi:hypothetical protein [Ectothiorhodospira shaposhnikovii]|uniref:hypothetical protein n=1 Tax=Ectothiorhodospira shaposhnikovii TaxID=1054 RepID=UPI001EE83CFD|nr:hypothetical protein [Ectothiorhodospira shaposhnikovii]MCG5512810.1 hypothetical protein [Ectothiorhodospira shaposhnikovii]
MSDTEAYALWPDGFYCHIEELMEQTHRSDDYRIIQVSDIDDQGRIHAVDPKTGQLYIVNEE